MLIIFAIFLFIYLLFEMQNVLHANLLIHIYVHILIRFFEIRCQSVKRFKMFSIKLKRRMFIKIKSDS